MNLYENTNNNKRYYALDYYYKTKFKTKISKLSIDAPFTCPNIDGTKGYNGCIYCASSNNNETITEQIKKQKQIINKKWPNSKHIIYLQSHSNTYGSIEKLKEIYEPLLKIDNVIGLSIGTRADCIDNDCLNYLEKLSKKTYLTVELGLQTIHQKTSKIINRCHTLEEFENTIKELKKRNINVVVHIINGLPFETKEMMIETIKYINKLNINGIKIHMLFIAQNAPIKNLKFKYLTREEYIDITCDQIEELNPDIVIHRLTGDGNKNTLIYPQWSLKKVSILNDIDKELKKRNTFQGFNKSIQNKINQLIIDNIKPNDLVINATNNNNFILSLIPKGHLYILNKALEKINYSNYSLLNNSNISDLYNKISLIIINIKDLINISIEEYMKLLNNKGTIIIKMYPELEKKFKLNELLENIEYSIYKNNDNPYLIIINNKISI